MTDEEMIQPVDTYGGRRPIRKAVFQERIRKGLKWYNSRRKTGNWPGGEPKLPNLAWIYCIIYVDLPNEFHEAHRKGEALEQWLDPLIK